jgi:hypothetical protein
MEPVDRGETSVSGYLVGGHRYQAGECDADDAFSASIASIAVGAATGVVAAGMT